jgi:hypothetical protein
MSGACFAVLCLLRVGLLQEEGKQARRWMLLSSSCVGNPAVVLPLVRDFQICEKLPFKQESCGLPMVLSFVVFSFFCRLPALQAGFFVCFDRNWAALKAVKAACFWG